MEVVRDAEGKNLVLSVFPSSPTILRALVGLKLLRVTCLSKTLPTIPGDTGPRTSPASPISRLGAFSMSLMTPPANYKYGRTAKDHSRHWMCIKVVADSRLAQLPDLLSFLDETDNRVGFAGAISNVGIWDGCKAVGRSQFRKAVVWMCFLKQVPARMAEDIANNIVSLPFLTFLGVHSDIPFKSVEDAELILGFVGWIELYGGGTARVERWVQEKFERYFPAAIEGWRQHEQHARVHALIATGELKWQTKAPPIPAPAGLAPNPVAQSAAPVTASTWTPPNIPSARIVLTSSKTANHNIPSAARDTRRVELKNAVRTYEPPTKKRKKEDKHVYTRLMTAAVKGNTLPITWPGHRPTFTE
ncbi:hypothetical protein EV714DRAFT_288095 [Schizophyllum commune]